MCRYTARARNKRASPPAQPQTPPITPAPDKPTLTGPCTAHTVLAFDISHGNKEDRQTDLTFGITPIFITLPDPFI